MSSATGAYTLTALVPAVKTLQLMLAAWRNNELEAGGASSTTTSLKALTTSREAEEELPSPTQLWGAADFDDSAGCSATAPFEFCAEHDAEVQQSDSEHSAHQSPRGDSSEESDEDLEEVEANMADAVSG